MELIEVENMQATELKTRMAEVIELVKAQPQEELAARYVQARLDATTRDEKLAEQGKTITALQGALDQQKEVLHNLQKANEVLYRDLKAVESDIAAANEKHAAAVSDWIGQCNDKDYQHAADVNKCKQEQAAAVAKCEAMAIEKDRQHAVILSKCGEQQAALNATLGKEAERSVRLRGEAIKHYTAMNEAAKLLNDAIATQRIEHADSGE